MSTGDDVIYERVYVYHPVLLIVTKKDLNTVRQI
jgi:hypothetical protein